MWDRRGEKKSLLDICIKDAVSSRWERLLEEKDEFQNANFKFDEKSEAKQREIKKGFGVSWYECICAHSDGGFRGIPGENDGVEAVEDPDGSDATTAGHCYLCDSELSGEGEKDEEGEIYCQLRKRQRPDVSGHMAKLGLLGNYKIHRSFFLIFSNNH
jgi:hypothetical protein